MDNLLCNLSRWAHRQAENFVTESFAFLLNYLLIHDEPIGRDLLQWLCFERGAANSFGLERPIITTQCHTAEGRPDIRIAIPSKLLIYIEVKQWSGVGPGQLERYHSELKKANLPVTKLILLTVDPVERIDERVKHVRWPNVAERMKHYTPNSAISLFLILQFVDFLKEQGMTMERVGWEYLEGMKSFRHLITMLAKAIELAGIKVHARSAQSDLMGFYLDDKNFLVAIAYNLPRYVRFSFFNAKHDPDKLEQVGRGQIDNGYLFFELDLQSEANHFFSRSAESQMLLLTEFLTTSFNDAKACLVDVQTKVLAS